SGRSVIIVMNKWDLAAEAARKAAAASVGASRFGPSNRAQLRAQNTAPQASKLAVRSKGKSSLQQDTRFRHAKAPAKAPVSETSFSEIDKSRLLFDYEKMVRGKLKFLSYAPIVFLSAKSGDRTQKLYPLIDEVAAARNRHIPTPELNRWLKEDVDLQRGTTPKARPVRIYYITQAKTSPPTFLLFTNQKQTLH